MGSEKKKKKSELPAEINQKVISLIQFATKAGKTLFGHDIVVRNLENRKIKLVILTKDLSPANRSKIQLLCQDLNVPCFVWGTKSESFKYAGRETGITGITDTNFANGIENCLSYKEVED